MSFEKVVIGNATPKWTAIYALCERESMEPRYVGKTTQCIIDRAKAHMRAAMRGGSRPVLRWLRKRHEAGGSALMLLEHVPPHGDWAARERHWIQEFKRRGHQLLNLTEGGEGLAGHQFSAEHRARIAAGLRTGSHITCLHCGALAWRKKNEIAKGDAKFCTRACYSASLRGVSKPVSPQHTKRAVEAAAAKRRERTHCKRAHPLSGDNLFKTFNGSRGCKECRRMHKANYLERTHG